ncbi:MAG: GGDEF domain-containing protein [Planctomycetes bacterium]|nr:GGDEF domain-containing protein [Planctomycetota bacterium]
MTKEEVLKTVLNSPSLPTLPTVASKLISISSKPETTMTEIANLISKDITMSAKLLKIANSAFYSFSSKISTVHQAVSNIGKNAIRSLVLSVSFLTIKTNYKDEVFDYEKHWQQSLSSAVAAKLIMAEVDKTDPEEIFSAALLQDIGGLILARSFPQQYKQTMKALSENNEDCIETERQIIGADHALVGYAVTRNWGFPAELLIPILYHHNPEGYKENNNKLKTAINVVHLSGIVTNILFSKNPQDYHRQFMEKSRKILNFDNKVADRILKKVHTEIADVAGFFDFNISNPKSIEEILQEANIALSLINLSYEQMNKELIAAKMELQKLAKDLEEKNKRLEVLANIDGLTDVYNHRYFQNFLETEIRRAMRKETSVSLILFDVDYFKKFNDSYGHQAGDFILKEMCKLVKKNIRDYDIVARYGGEEFAIVLVETPEEEAIEIAEKLRETIAAHIFIDGINEYTVTASFGVATMSPAIEEIKQGDFIESADKALYESKKKGRNKVTAHIQKKKWFGKG